MIRIEELLVRWESLKVIKRVSLIITYLARPKVANNQSYIDKLSLF